jgi:hypothetical protein
MLFYVSSGDFMNKHIRNFYRSLVIVVALAVAGYAMIFLGR